ncbi:stalk domain-containing protein [Paenibacillus sp. YIM B09110]|uniref:stalk domain-containing protein n=1 Tax=Paenibacillus sp. YIM B09110 TaxID=3126102 RepID=UPI00301BE14A
MKRYLSLLVVFCLTVLSVASLGTVASAASTGTKVIGVAYDNILLDDGSIWVKNSNGPIRKNLDIAQIVGYGKEGFGVTKKGELVSWDYITEPAVDTKQTGISQLVFGSYLKTDGTLWSTDGYKMTSNVRLIGGSGGSLAYLTKSGVLSAAGVEENYTLSDAASIIAIDATLMEYNKGRTATLSSSGEVMIYDERNIDYENGWKIIPEKVTSDASGIVFADNGQLLVTLKDGTVWVTGDYEYRYKLEKQLTGIKNVKQISALKDDESFYFLTNSGDWKLYQYGLEKQIEIPKVADLTFELSNLTPNVGDSIKAEISETYSTGETKKVPLSQANVQIDKPHLLKAMGNGTFKALGVGVSKVTVTSGTAAKTLTVTTSLSANLKNAAQIKNVTYVPIQSVFKSIGGTVVYTAASKTFDIKVGSTAIKLKSDEAKATVNGKEVVLGGPIQTANGTAVFPAALLTKVFGAKLQWDTKYKTITILFGAAKMKIETPDTANVLKREALGTLTKYIGKSYWSNHIPGADRFIKLTIVDIIPDASKDFVIVFQTTKGVKVKSSVLYGSSAVESYLATDYYLLTYDPYKKYNWSTKIWTAVKAEKIGVGMTKDQVLLSWGNPSSTSVISGSGIVIETWGYGLSSQYVTFKNGKVSQIYTI